MNQKKIEEWLDILNEISVFLEAFVACEDDKRRIRDLDKVIDGLYNMSKKTS